MCILSKVDHIILKIRTEQLRNESGERQLSKNT